MPKGQNVGYRRTEHIDLIAGISVCNVGHRHPKVVEAIRRQADQYLHIMVYGELVENPQVAYAQKLTNQLPESLNAVFYTASGSEATEGAMKLAKAYRARPDHFIQTVVSRQHAGARSALWEANTGNRHSGPFTGYPATGV